MAEDLTTASLRAIRRILRAADQGGRKLAATTGLTPSQILVLQEIDRRGETTPGAIAAALSFGQGTVTTIIDKLEAAQLVTRRRGDQDKRQILLRATERAGATLQAAPDLLQQRFSDRYRSLPAWEQAMILAALERLGGMLDAEDIDAAPLIDTGLIDR
jgi:DNA-binding MarR family transcriptional regulator